MYSLLQINSNHINCSRKYGKSSIANPIEHVHCHRSIIIEQNVDIRNHWNRRSQYSLPVSSLPGGYHAFYYCIVILLFLVESARKEKIIHLENLVHYSIHSHLVIVNQNGGISLKYWGGLSHLAPQFHHLCMVTAYRPVARLFLFVGHNMYRHLASL